MGFFSQLGRKLLCYLLLYLFSIPRPPAFFVANVVSCQYRAHIMFWHCPRNRTYCYCYNSSHQGTASLELLCVHLLKIFPQFPGTVRGSHRGGELVTTWSPLTNVGLQNQTWKSFSLVLVTKTRKGCCRYDPNVVASLAWHPPPCEYIICFILSATFHIPLVCRMNKISS